MGNTFHSNVASTANAWIQIEQWVQVVSNPMELLKFKEEVHATYIADHGR